MPTRYSSREQEKNYQTTRVFVAKEVVYNQWNSPAYNRWRVIRMDMATHEFEESDRMYTKAGALDCAKSTAQMKNLPFDLQKDIVDYAWVRRGPTLRCIACGEKWNDTFYREWKRGWEPELCPRCKAAFDIGNQVREERTDCVWSDYNGLGEISEIFRDIALAMMQANTGKHEQMRGAEVIGEYHPTSYGHHISVTEKQRDAARALIVLIKQAMKSSYKKGYFDGSSLLHRLAKCEVSPNEFADTREAKSE